MTVAAFDDLSISIYYPGRLAPAGHLLNVRVSAKGDHGAEDLWPDSSGGRGPALASGVEVQAPGPHHVLVAFGDSITEGAGATPGTNLDWPEQFARRLASHGWSKDWVVINSGIGGNRLLHEGSGPKALDRFDRDALELSGASAIVLLEGINDIGWAFDADGDTGPLTATDIEAAYQQLIARAHAQGLKIYGETLAPYEGAKYSHPEGEAVRAAVNEWIRTSGAFDGVIDLSARCVIRSIRPVSSARTNRGTACIRMMRAIAPCQRPSIRSCCRESFSNRPPAVVDGCGRIGCDTTADALRGLPFGAGGADSY